LLSRDAQARANQGRGRCVEPRPLTIIAGLGIAVAVEAGRKRMPGTAAGPGQALEPAGE